jgi:bla regulator protein BlaR1
MEVRDDKDNIYRVKIENGKVVSLKINNARIPEDELGQYEKLLAEIDKSYYAARESKRASIERAHRYSRNEREIKELKSKDWDSNGKDGKDVRKEFKIDKSHQKEFKKDNDGQKHLKLEKQKHKEWKEDKKFKVKKMPEPADISADQERVRGVISELVEAKVISKPTDLEWFGLSEGELVVNGNKQPVELQQKIEGKI